MIRYLVPGRFLMTFGHLMVTLMAYSHTERNAYAGLGLDPTEAQKTAASANMISALGFAVACFVLHFTSMFMGLSLYNTKVRSTTVLV